MMRCQFCKKICEDIDALQLHQVASCPAIEEGDRSLTFEEEKVEVVFKWLNDREISVPSVYLIGSDMVDNIELKKGDGCFKSDNVMVTTGNYSGQLVVDLVISPVNNFLITLLSEDVNIITEEVKEEHSNVTNITEMLSMNVKNNECVEAHQHETTSVITTNYTLNKKLSLKKKMTACDRDHYNVVQRDNCTTVTFNTASFEVFRTKILKYLESRSDTYKIETTEVRDKRQNITQDILRVMNTAKRNNTHIYTVNMYRTTCRVMVNGPFHTQFLTADLPMVTGQIDRMDHAIEEVNDHIKHVLVNTHGETQIPHHSEAISNCNEKPEKKNETQLRHICDTQLPHYNETIVVNVNEKAENKSEQRKNERRSSTKIGASQDRKLYLTRSHSRTSMIDTTTEPTSDNDHRALAEDDVKEGMSDVNQLQPHQVDQCPEIEMMVANKSDENKEKLDRTPPVSNLSPTCHNQSTDNVHQVCIPAQTEVVMSAENVSATTDEDQGESPVALITTKEESLVSCVSSSMPANIVTPLNDDGKNESSRSGSQSNSQDTEARPKRTHKQTQKMKEYKDGQIQSKPCKNSDQERIPDEKEPLVCICKTVYKESDSEFMIMCNYCSQWFHGKCVGGLTAKNSTGIVKYMCSVCQSIDHENTHSEDDSCDVPNDNTRIDKLQLMIDQKDDKINSLKTSECNLIKDLNIAKVEFQKLHDFTAEKDQLLQQQTQKLTTANNENKAAKGQNLDKGGTIKQLEAQIKKVTDENDKLENKIKSYSESRKQNGKLHDKIDTLENHIGILRTTISSLEATNEENQTVIKNVTLARDTHKEVTEQLLRAAAASDDSQFTDAMKRLQQVDRQDATTQTDYSLKELENKCSQFTKEVKSLKQKVAELEKNLSTVQSQKATLEQVSSTRGLELEREKHINNIFMKFREPSEITGNSSNESHQIQTSSVEERHQQPNEEEQRMSSMNSNSNNSNNYCELSSVK